MVGKNLTNSLAKAQEVLSSIEALRPGDRVVILWHDACRVTNDPDVRPEYYSTPKETQGTVYDCVPDPDYPTVYYLIVCGETTGGKPDYYDAIPIAWIAKIEKLEISVARRPRKASKLTTDLYTVRRVIVFKEAKIREDSGGVSKLPMKSWGRGTASRKFVEEIVKVVQ